MKTASKKAKGRKLQDMVRDLLLSKFKTLEGDDINQELLDELGWEEFPEDFDWWDSIDELDGMSGQEYIDDAVYNWFEIQ